MKKVKQPLKQFVRKLINIGHSIIIIFNGNIVKYIAFFASIIYPNRPILKNEIGYLKSTIALPFNNPLLPTDLKDIIGINKNFKSETTLIRLVFFF